MHIVRPKLNDNLVEHSVPGIKQESVDLTDSFVIGVLLKLVGPFTRVAHEGTICGWRSLALAGSPGALGSARMTRSNQGGVGSCGGRGATDQVRSRA